MLTLNFFAHELGLIPSLALQQHRMTLQRQKRDQVAYFTLFDANLNPRFAILEIGF